MSRVSITIPSIGRTIDSWGGLQIIRAVDAGADAFAFSLPFEPTLENKNTFVAYRPSRVEIKIDDQLVITGRIESITASYDASNKTIEIQGRSLSGSLMDWSAGPPFEWANGTTFNEIARSIAKSVDGKFGPAEGISVTAVPNVQIPIASIENPGQTVYDFLTSIASSQGLWAIPQPQGSLVYRRLSSTRSPVADLQEGQAPLVSINTVHDVTKRFYEYFVIQDADGNFSEAVEIDQGVDNRIRGRRIIQPSIESWDLQEAARHAKASGLIDSYQASATLTGWAHNGRVWQAGDIIRIYAPSAMIYNPSRFIIRRAVLQLDENGGEVTNLELALPELYDGKDPLERPWGI
jgi:prophage tail gpP-like protein